MNYNSDSWQTQKRAGERPTQITQVWYNCENHCMHACIPCVHAVLTNLFGNEQLRISKKTQTAVVRT